MKHADELFKMILGMISSYWEIYVDFGDENSYMEIYNIRNYTIFITLVVYE